MIDSVAKELAEKIHSHLSRHPNGELKGVLAALPVGDRLVGFKAIVTLESDSAAVESPEAERDMFYDLTSEHPDVKFVLFHSHPDWIPHYSGGDHTNYQKVYNGTDGYCDLQLLFHRTERRGVTMKTYRVSSSGVSLQHEGMSIIGLEKLSAHVGTIRNKTAEVGGIARRHGFR